MGGLQQEMPRSERPPLQRPFVRVLRVGPGATRKCRGVEGLSFRFGMIMVLEASEFDPVRFLCCDLGIFIRTVLDLHGLILYQTEGLGLT